jgi:hypothetical protein
MRKKITLFKILYWQFGYFKWLLPCPSKAKQCYSSWLFFREQKNRDNKDIKENKT